MYNEGAAGIDIENPLFIGRPRALLNHHLAAIRSRRNSWCGRLAGTKSAWRIE
jgi:hypothetical protein